LIIYLSAFNGMSYENFSLFETLASKGFVVISISSIGRFPGDMTMKKEDLMEQVNDAIASVNKLQQETNIDFTKIGVIGYSWGGLAGAVLAGKIPNVACLVSLDGSEFHHYGEAKEEDADFDGIKNSVDFKNMQLSMPYLRLESQPQTENSFLKNSFLKNQFTPLIRQSMKTLLVISCSKRVWKL
jgi:pimeloyl-ACP methyl ester carboxylesterase